MPEAPVRSASDLCSFANMLFAHIDKVLELGHEQSGSVFAGPGGYLYTCMICSQCIPNEHLWKHRVIQWTRVVEMQKPPKRLGTFVEGDTGPKALLIALKGGTLNDASVLLAGLLSSANKANSDPSFPNELWYGRAGVLHSLFVASSGTEAQEVRARVRAQMIELFDEIVRQGGEGNPPVMMWTWHGKAYYGLVHGVCGIVVMTLRVWETILNEEEKAARRKSFDSILAVARFMLTECFPSGNLPSSSGSRKDDLVQICHGAPGFVLMCLACYRCTKEDTFLRHAVEAAEQVVWTRGLLKKGLGLCHGIGGNALVLLEVYRATHDRVWLYRCLHFLDFGIVHANELIGVPDDPLSFVNGVAGFVTALAIVHREMDQQGERTSFVFPII